ncbi:MAG: secretion protein HlyD [Pseudomonadota bacterium]
MKRLLAALLILAAAVGVGWYVWLAPEEDGDQALVLYGNVDVRTVELGFRLPGRVESLAPEEGDRVERGELLARLEPRPFEDELAVARAEHERAQAELARLTAGSRPSEIERARAQVAEQEAALANRESGLARHADLLERNAVSRQAFDDALAARDAAAARLRAAREALELAREGFREEEIRAARAAVRAGGARVAAAETPLADARLHAPESGTILTRVREPGAVVGAGVPVYTLAVDRPVWVRSYVGEPNLGRVSPGQRALVYTDSRPDEPYIGRVGFVSPTAEFTPKSVQTPELRTALVYRFRVVVSDPDDGLRQGMPVTVQLPDAGAR